MLYVVLILLLVCALLAYFLGVKKQQGWGLPVVVVCAVGALIVLGFVLFGGRAGAGAAVQVNADVESKRARQVGEGLSKSSVTVGSLVLVDSAVLGPEQMAKKTAAWEDGLSQGAGRSVRIVRCVSIEEPGYLAQTLGNISESFDGVILARGLALTQPVLEELRSKVGDKKVVACVAGKADLAGLKALLQAGLLNVVVVEDESGSKVYTPDKLP